MIKTFLLKKANNLPSSSGCYLLKDEVNNSTYIIKAKNIKDDFLMNVIINEFDSNFNLQKVIQSKKVYINEIRTKI